MRWTLGFVNRCVMAWDAALLACVLGINWLRHDLSASTASALESVVALILMVQIYLGVMHALGGYRYEVYRILPRQAVYIIASLALAAAPLLLLYTFVPHEDVSGQSWIIASMTVAAAVLFLGRLLVRTVVGLLRRRGTLRYRVVVVGANAIAATVINRLTEPGVAEFYDVVALFDDLDAAAPHGAAPPHGAVALPLPVSGSLADVTRYAQSNPVHMFIIAERWSETHRIFDVLTRLQVYSADILLPLLGGVGDLQVPQKDELAGLPVLTLMRAPLKGTQALIKSIEDYVVATLGLIATLPIIAVAAVAIRLESPGPVFFRQPRVGLNNRIFTMYKLRTMTVCPEDDGTRGTRRDDQRITRVGQFLRRTSLDELPQLFNVLRGEMSIVGPRPHVPNMLVGERPYYDVVKRYMARSRIKPGITGRAQINGMRGGIDTKEKAARGVELDSYYIENWSIWLDIKIMFKTLLIGMAGRDVF